MTARPGRVILLNGASSSGKSTIAARLLDDLDSPWFHMPVDAFGAMRSESRTHELEPDALVDVLRRTRAGYHRAVAAMARAGNDVVMDYVLSESWRLYDLLEVMRGIDVVFVGVHCSADELRRRERLRGDRPVGTADAQFEAVHADTVYDVEVDTTSDSAETCSRAIVDALDRHSRGPDERAFERLRRERASG